MPNVILLKVIRTSLTLTFLLYKLLKFSTVLYIVYLYNKKKSEYIILVFNFSTSRFQELSLNSLKLNLKNIAAKPINC